MVDTFFPKSGAVNTEVLDTDLKAAVASITGTSTLPGQVKVISSVALSLQEQATTETIINNHNAVTLSDNQQIEVSRQIAITAKTYFRNQLLSGNTNIGQIFTQIKGYIDSNPKLLTMQNTEIQLKALVFGWNSANVIGAGEGSTNIIKGQYVEAAMSIVGAVA